MGNTYAYQPMTPQRVASEEEVTAMQEKLQARVRAAGSTPAPADNTAEKPAKEVAGGIKTQAFAPAAKPLEWDRPKTKDATGVKTKCGRYSCAKITQDGKVTYELFKLAAGGAWFRTLNKGLDNFLQVQKLAQIDADKGAP